MRIDVPGATLEVKTIGSGAPALMLHGFPFSSEMWGPVASRLAARGFRLLIPDLCGFGGSSGSPAVDLSTHVADLVAVLDAFKLLDPLPWIGFSMGGYVALDAWRRRPERIGALALVDTRAGADDAKAQAGRRATADRVEREGSAVVVDAMLPKLFAGATSEMMRRAVRVQMLGASSPGVAAALRAMAARPDSVSMLPTIDVPTLVVTGVEDAITPTTDAQALAAGIPGAQLRLVEGAGHLSPIEQPDAVVEALADFLRRAAPANR